MLVNKYKLAKRRLHSQSSTVEEESKACIRRYRNQNVNQPIHSSETIFFIFFGGNPLHVDVESNISKYGYSFKRFNIS